MVLTLSQLERDTLLSWKRSSKIILPNEQMLIELLQNHKGGELELTENQVVILSSWAESSVDGNFGSGSITNITEKQALEKINDAVSSMSTLTAVPVSKLTAVKHVTAKGSRLKNKRLVIVIITVMLFLVLYLFLGRR